ncbi:recombination protein F [Mycobacteroides abscessus subsp. abscessus]|uniref:ATP-dependent nuclease n=1 Tax=Mycobacteroides abscessus TaxID=36809 RepID=UPI000926CF52|nr:AAA family ATPase [Mycobacteroides abscessus]SIL04429.1 recombination protein F [Mycobacteroides abscessus subsp. abscessus]SLE09021.1 recombination protein F [Mycobacteroides abscessus subsp. abscessus]
MRIERVRVSNFRNLADVDLPLGPGSVIVGENRSGKSNLVYALRLVLDTSLSISDRQLGRDDFWDGLSDGSDNWDPLADGHVIEISVDLVDFADNPRELTAVADALLEENPPRARLTYRFGPVDMGDDTIPLASRYQGRVHGGEDYSKDIPILLRRHLHFHLLPALRDVESDIQRWRHSPLRELLERAAQQVPEADLNRISETMRAANCEVNALTPITELGMRIGTKLADMVGPTHAVDTSLAVAPEEPIRLIRAMRIFLDGPHRRSLSSASLGTLNVLYLALLDLGLADRLAAQTIAHTFMAIEEPEAHLHPHLQRVIFSQYLKDASATRSVLVTTQSPHVVSVTDPQSLIVLRTVNGATTSCAASTADLEVNEWKDIARYLDATRAEIVFARKVLLVEGFAEQVLLPVLAANLGLDLDRLGISVCAIHGTHFSPYVRFCDALSIPWAVLTDGDPDAEGISQGAKRVADLLSVLGLDGTPGDNGCFVGAETFEYDLISDEPSNTAAAFEALHDLSAAPSQAAVASWKNSVPDRNDFMKAIKNAGGKGRYAQRLALADVRAPAYIASALQYLVG